MKRCVVELAFLAALLAWVPGCQQAKPEQAGAVEQSPKKSTSAIEFAEKAYDFGTINDGDTVKHVFAFKNVGKVPLILSDVSSSCGCTIPEWSNRPVAPGKSGAINVVFTKTGDPGVHKRLVIIKANTDPEYSTISIKAQVAPPDEDVRASL